MTGLQKKKKKETHEKKQHEPAFFDLYRRADRRCECSVGIFNMLMQSGLIQSILCCHGELG